MEEKRSRRRRATRRELTKGEKLDRGSLLIMVGVLILGFTIIGGFKLIQAMDSYNWPSTTGTVLQSYVKSHPSTCESGTTYSAVVVYEFMVGGENYTEDTVKLGSEGTSSSELGKPTSSTQKIVDRYPVGSTVTVYYDPDDPNKSALEIGVHWDVFLLPGIGLGQIILVIFIYKRDL